MPTELTIVSGGQTGVDRAALDWAIEHGWSHGGYCPKGRIAEDGLIPRKYNLKEASSSEYAIRTRLNVIHSDATLILSPLPLTGGTALTTKYAEQEGRAIFTISPGFEQNDLSVIHSFLAARNSCNLNVAGPRLSQWPDSRDFAKKALNQAFPDNAP
jgi:predicted Rossmann fold nucleotide-binding protein DprA/Smf involved in DNA uptake